MLRGTLSGRAAAEIARHVGERIEETFGPLAPLSRFKDVAEVIAMSNDIEFGLASYSYARDMSRVFRVA